MSRWSFISKLFNFSSINGSGKPNIDGTTYYVDVINGDDNHTGTSKQRAWKT